MPILGVVCGSSAWRSKAKGFSLIELLIVISLFSLITGLITASYVGFEKDQRGKLAASSVISDIRYVQNQASSGLKGNACDPDPDPANLTYVYKYSTLVAWYIDIPLASSTSNNTYTINNLCVNTINSSNTSEPCGNSANGNYECTKIFKTLSLPYGLSFHDSSASFPNSHEYVFFQPLNSEPIFCNVSSGTPSSFLSTLTPVPVVNLANCTGGTSGPLVINIYGPDASNVNTLNILQSGGVK